MPGPAAVRLDPGRPGSIALVLVVILAAAVAAFGVWNARPEAQPIAALPAVAASPAGGGTGQPGQAVSPGAPVLPVPSGVPGSGSPVVVSVVGKVARPGLVRVADGARVADAVDAAGGALPGVDLSVLNLARRVGDGEQIAVGVPPAADAAPGDGPASGNEPGVPPGRPLPAGGSGASTAAGGGPGTGGGKIDLNTATVDQLDELPGIGPVTATKIIDWRNRNGRFARVEQLREVDGIGERRYAQLAGLVRV